MEPNGKDLIGFFDYAADKGLMGRDWAATLKSACKSVLSTVEPDAWETLDISDLDIDALILRFERLKMANLKPDSLNVYGKRIRNGVAAYLEFLRSPSTWQYKSARSDQPARSAAKKAQRPKKQEATGPSSTVLSLSAAGAPQGLIQYPYPLRPGVILTISLPADLTQKEAGRLSTFVHSLAVDEQRALPAARHEEAS
jgi:hypothetical protein